MNIDESIALFKRANESIRKPLRLKAAHAYIGISKKDDSHNGKAYWRAWICVDRKHYHHSQHFQNPEAAALMHDILLICHKKAGNHIVPHSNPTMFNFPGGLEAIPHRIREIPEVAALIPYLTGESEFHGYESIFIKSRETRSTARKVSDT